MKQKEVKTTIQDLLDYSERTEKGLMLKLVSQEHQLEKKLLTSSINRPGLNFFGFYDFFAFQRIQLIGRGEFAYLEKLHKEGKLSRLKKFFTFDMPAVVFTHGHHPYEEIIKMARAHKIPIMVTELSTSIFVNRLQIFFSKALAPRVIMHGVMLELFGLGILLEGEPGTGKSECALELIERGHRFIADDVVDVRLIDNKILLASSSKVIAHHMEIQGIGIINIAHLFGVRSIRDEITVDMVVHIENADKNKKYDRLGLQTHYKDILGISMPLVTIPVRPGTNLPILIETAALNQRLKFIGYNTAKEFNKKLTSFINKGIEIY